MGECKICNGTHVYYGEGKGFGMFVACYECGPKPLEMFDLDMAILKQRIAVAKKVMEVKA